MVKSKAPTVSAPKPKGRPHRVKDSVANLTTVAVCPRCSSVESYTFKPSGENKSADVRCPQCNRAFKVYPS